MELVAAKGDVAVTAGRVVELLQDLADVPIATLRSISQESSVTHAVQLAEALLQLVPPNTSADWMRCLLSELYFIAGRPADSIAVVTELSKDAAPSVTSCADVAKVLASALLQPNTAEAAARRRLQVGETWAVHDAAAVAAASLLADCRARAGDVETALYWSRLVVTHIELVPSSFWNMHLLIEAASRLADAGEDSEAEALVDQVRAQSERVPYSGIAAALARIQAKVLIHRGLWSTLNSQFQEVTATMTPDKGERLHTPLLLAQLSIAAVYAGDLSAARKRIEVCQLLSEGWNCQPRNARHMPESLWAQLLLEKHEDGCGPVANHLLRLARDPSSPLIWLFSTVPGAAAWAARIAMGADQQELVRYVVAAVEDVRAFQPSRAVTLVQHVQGVLESDTVALAQAAARHWHAWARAQAANDLAAILGARGSAPAAWHDESSGRHHSKWPVVRSSAATSVAVPETVTSPDHVGPTDVHLGTEWNALSVRERQIARLAAAGLTNQQIASRVQRSVHTVNFHLRSVFRKLKIASRVEISRHVPHSDIFPGEGRYGSFEVS